MENEIHNPNKKVIGDYETIGMYKRLLRKGVVVIYKLKLISGFVES